MKYVGPVSVTSRDISALNDYCREHEVIPYFWGLPGEQIFAFPAHGLNVLDTAKLPRAFAGLEWRDTPYAEPRTLDEVIEALPEAEQVAIEGRAADLIAEEEVERLEPEEFVHTISSNPADVWPEENLVNTATQDEPSPEEPTEETE